MATNGISYNFLFRAQLFLCLAVLTIIGLGSEGSCLAAAPVRMELKNASVPGTEKNFGIKIVSLRPTGGGQMLDLRFQVIDPEKAKGVLDKNKKAYVLDDKSGKSLPVPVTKAGPMRQTTLNSGGQSVFHAILESGRNGQGVRQRQPPHRRLPQGRILSG